MHPVTAVDRLQAGPAIRQELKRMNENNEIINREEYSGLKGRSEADKQPNAALPPTVAALLSPRHEPGKSSERKRK